MLFQHPSLSVNEITITGLAPRKMQAAALMHQPAGQCTNQLRITRDNAAENQPPSLKRYRTAESRAAGSAPALWFQAMTGDAWDPPTPYHSS